VSGDDPELIADRLVRLEEELTGEDVQILRPDQMPKGFEDPIQLRAALLEELNYARHAPVHEGRRPPYGCLIVQNISIEIPGVDRLLQPSGGGSLAELRPFSDGRSTMLLRDLHDGCAIAVASLPDELSIVQMTRVVPAVAVQRLPNDAVKVFDGQVVATNEGFDWSVRRYARSHLAWLAEALAPPTPFGESLLERLASLLDFCLHGLSPRRIGATIVLTLWGEFPNDIGLSDEGTPPAVELDAADPDDQRPLATVLASVDGACLLDVNGRVVRLEAKLGNSPESVRVVPEHGGTRHTSARRFSYDHSNVLVFVVSADGPVTLFSDGSATLSLRPHDDRAWHVSLPHDQVRSLEESTVTTSCEACGRPVRCRAVTGPGGETRGLSCPVCGSADVASFASALEASAVPAKSWGV
jgi:DNA integrity scanning protein DisA with diadenylate cyclase activity